MRKNGKIKMALRSILLSMMFVLPLSLQAKAEIRQLTMDADLEGITVTEGVPFLPNFSLDEDDVSLELEALPEQLDPTRAVVLKGTLYSSYEAFSDNLRVGGKGIRRTYVDNVSIDQDKASIRLELYPFYQLRTPGNLRIDGTQVRWDAVEYAGSYELVVSYTAKNGDWKQIKKRSDSETLDVRSELLTAARQDSNQQTDAETLWTEARSAGGFDVAVRAIPSKARSNQYCNIAKSGFVSLYGVDVSEFEEDDVWEQVGQYQAVVDSETGLYVHGSGLQGNASAGPAGTGTGIWKRVSYHWQYLIDGVVVNSSWQQIGGVWYYFNPDGYMATGWLQDQGQWYYLEPKVGATQGIMTTGEREIDGVRYYFAGDGAMAEAPSEK